ncbi:MAG: hypothetical protein ACFFCE_06375 [Promethearchaeota archaeon]
MGIYFYDTLEQAKKEFLHYDSFITGYCIITDRTTKTQLKITDNGKESVIILGKQLSINS